MWPEMSGQTKRAPKPAADEAAGRATQVTTKPPRARQSKQQRQVQKRTFTEGRENPQETSSSTDTQAELTRKGGQQAIPWIKPQNMSSHETSEEGRPAAEGSKTPTPNTCFFLRFHFIVPDSIISCFTP